MSCQRVNYVPSKCHRVLPRRETPSYKTPPYTRIYIYILSRHPCGRSRATPCHEYIYIDRPSRHFSFGSSLCRMEPKCVHPFDTLFISTGRVCLFEGRAPLHAVFIGNSRMSDEPESDANDPFVLARKSLEFRQDSSSGRQYSRDNMYRVREPLGIKVRHAQEISRSFICKIIFKV